MQEAILVVSLFQHVRVHSHICFILVRAWVLQYTQYRCKVGVSWLAEAQINFSVQPGLNPALQHHREFGQYLTNVNVNSQVYLILLHSIQSC